MKRYLIKVNGARRCPGGISRPNSGADWEGGEVLLKAEAPVLARKGERQKAPYIQVGDELWIWTHEDKKYGNGWGLTVKATAGAQRLVGGEVALEMHNVQRLPHPFGFRDLGDDPTGSRLIDYIRTFRHRLVYLIEDDDYDDFVRLVEARAAPLPDEVRYSGETGWAREIRENKSEILESLADRRRNWRKARPDQARFRAEVLDLYNGRCVLTGCAVPEALEAAHVLPHNGAPVRDRADNGLLLRRDLHTMFDAMLWSIDPDTSAVQLSGRLRDQSYASLNGKAIKHQVAPEPLRVHFIQFQKADKDV